MQRNRLLDFTAYLIVRLLVCMIQALRLETCQVLARLLAVLMCDLLPMRRGVIDDNLRHAFTELSPRERRNLSRQMWEHLFLLVVEVAHAPRKIHDSNWRDYIDLVRQDIIVGSLFDDRPTILVAGHFGNFELCGYILGVLGFPSYAIARPLDNPYLDKFLNDFRGGKGQHILPKAGSAKQVDALLASGGTLALLADQDAGPKGCWVNFFGRPASTHKAIALFSMASTAPLIVCYARRTGKPLCHKLGAEAILDPLSKEAAAQSVPAITQWYTDQLERIIRRAPQQYWWVHRRWKDTRKAVKKDVAKTAA